MSVRTGLEPAAGAILLVGAVGAAVSRANALYGQRKVEPAPKWGYREIAACWLGVMPLLGLFSAAVARQAVPGGFVAGYVLSAAAWALAAWTARLEAKHVRRRPTSALLIVHSLAFLLLLARFFAQVFEAATGTGPECAPSDWMVTGLSAGPLLALAVDSLARRATFARALAAYGALDEGLELAEAGKGPAPEPPPVSLPERAALVWRHVLEKTVPRLRANAARLAEMAPFVWPANKARAPPLPLLRRPRR
eukprot:tig00001187_g7450.t1